MENYKNCEKVPIKVNRVFDSCSDKDCVSGVKVTLSRSTPLPFNATIVKTRCVNVSDACISVEPIPFNKGFYSVDILFNLDVELLAYETSCSAPTTLIGTASLSKNCILFGSETNTKTFSSDGTAIGSTSKCCRTVNPPTAIVQSLSPLVLESKITNICSGCECNAENLVNEGCKPSRMVELTLGLFYVVELVRPVTIMVPTYNYNIPKKECCTNNDTPYEMFDKIKFPTKEFSPIKFEASQCSCQELTEQDIVVNPCDCQSDQIV